MKIAVINTPDSNSFLRNVSGAANLLGWAIQGVNNIAAIEQLVRQGKAEVVALHCTGIADTELIRRFRREHRATTVVAIVRTSESDLAAALLAAGSHEVITTSMGVPEVRERLTRAANQQGSSAEDSILFAGGDLSINGMDVTWQGKSIELSKREAALLEVLARANGHAVARESLYRAVWGFAMVKGDRIVDVNVSRLRTKLLGATQGVIEIKTAKGTGYKLTLVANLKQAPIGASN